MDVSTTIFTGICNGIGTATGSYIAVKYAIKHIDTLDRKIKTVGKKYES